MRRAIPIRTWIPAALWAAMILAASGNVVASDRTAPLIQAILAATIGRVSDLTFEVIHFAFRKIGHVLAYAVAGALNFRAVRGSRSGWTFAWSAVAVALAVATASIDEWHQSFFTSRTGVPADVVIDTCGAVLAQIVMRSIGSRR